MTDHPNISADSAVENTDREIWCGPDEGNGAYYADSLHVTKDGGLGINCGGYVYVKPIREWHRLAGGPERFTSSDGGVENQRHAARGLRTPKTAQDGQEGGPLGSAPQGHPEEHIAGVVSGPSETIITDVAQTEKVRLATIEECAQIAETQAQEFLSPEYAANQPLGSFCERFACEEVAKTIRALASPPVDRYDEAMAAIDACIGPAHNGSSAGSRRDEIAAGAFYKTRGDKNNLPHIVGPLEHADDGDAPWQARVYDQIWKWGYDGLANADGSPHNRDLVERVYRPAPALNEPQGAGK